MSSTIDWRWINSFVLVIEHGGVNRAAHASHLSQPTLSRHLKSLESHFGTPLVRFAGGLTITELGEQVLTQAKAMAKSAEITEFLARDTRSSSQLVRVSVSPAIAQFVLPSVIEPLPDNVSSIEIVVQGGLSDLLRRESELAIRLLRPTQLELKARKLGEIGYGVYVHRQLVPKKRRVTREDVLSRNLKLIGIVSPNEREAAALKHIDLQDVNCQLSCDDPSWRITAVERALGAGVIPTYVGDRNNDLLRVADIELPISQEVWLTASKAALARKPTKRLFDALAQRIIDFLDHDQQPALRN